MKTLINVGLALKILNSLDDNFDERIVVRSNTFYLDSLALLTPKIKQKVTRLFQSSDFLKSLNDKDISQIEVMDEKITVHFSTGQTARTFHIRSENNKVSVVDVSDIRNDYGSTAIFNSLKNIFGVDLSEYQKYYISIAEKSLKDGITAILNILTSKLQQSGLSHLYNYTSTCSDYIMTPYGAEIVTNFGDISYVDSVQIPKDFICVTNPAPNPIISIYTNGELLMSVRFKFEMLYDDVERIKIVIEPGAAFKKLNGKK